MKYYSNQKCTWCVYWVSLINFRELNKVAPEVNKGKVILQNFTREGGQSLNPASIGPDGVESLSKSDMSVTSQDAMTTVIYKVNQSGDMPVMEESKL